MANLRVLHVDLDTGAMVAKPGSVGGGNGGGNGGDDLYLKLEGGQLTGPLLLDDDPEHDLQATPKRYVDTQITTIRNDISQLASNFSNGISQMVRKTGDSMTGHLRLNDDPVEPMHAATKQFVDRSLNERVILKTGGTMTGPLQLDGSPSLDSHAATKGYVDRKVADITGGTDFLSIDGGELNGNVTLNVTPTESNHLVTKEYVDSRASGMSFKDPVRVASVSNITELAGYPQIDGIQLSENDRVLIKDQEDPILNGIYLASSDQWVRSNDASGTNMGPGAIVHVLEGDQNADSGWILANDNQVVFDQTDIRFVMFSSTKTDEQYVNVGGDNMVGSLYLVGEPIDSNEAANKGYIDRRINEIGYKYYQDEPSDVWLVEHNKSTENLMVQVFDPEHEMVLPSAIKVIDPNTVRIEFGTAMVSGTAQLLFL